MVIPKIKKRSGEVVDFDPVKIGTAIGKALMASKTSFTQETLSEITDAVVKKIEGMFEAAGITPHVENVQDIVEKTLMEKGFYDAAKGYILYRKEHEKIRIEKKQEVLQKIEEKGLYVIKSSGKKEKFDERKLRRAVAHAVKGYESVVDIDAIVNQCKEGLYEEIKTKDIHKALMMTTRAWIEQDPAYSFVCARILLSGLYKEVIGADVDFKSPDEQYRKTFVQNIKKAVQAEVLAKDLLEYDLEAIAKKLDPERDTLFAYLGIQTLYDRYFARNAKSGEIYETPQAFWMRVAMGLAMREEKKEEKAIEFYNIISQMFFVPSTPTLFHAGATHPQLSSCYLTTVEDDLAHIFKCIGDNAQLSKWSGGLGNDWTNLRGTGALIKKTGVGSQGIIPFLKIANDTTVAINRSGKRRGATCAYLETWHYDIEDFLELRKNTGDERRRTHDMNTSNWIPDLFMKRVQDDGEWTLFSPDETPDLHHIYGTTFEARYAEYEHMAKEGKIALSKTMKARDLWKKMVTMLFETGHPWITFKDPSNIRSPQDHAGVVHGSNLCTEITLNTSKDETAVCNLGSVNLARHVRNGKLDEEQIKKTVTTAMRMLDNVIDINFYPTPEAKYANVKHRPVGLGVMGFVDALFLLDIQFDSEGCVAFADESMELISYFAILASSQLAKERGRYESYKGSKWDRGIFPVDTMALLEKERGMRIDVSREGRLDWTPVRDHIKEFGMRNSNCLAIAPTATISNIAGVFPSIEPIYKNIYVKSNQGGEYIMVNSYLVEDLKKLKLWDHEMLGKLKYNDGSLSAIKEVPEYLKNKYKETFEIDPVWLVRAAAYRGKWIDQSQSLNIFFKGTSGKDISNIYMYAWTMGLKTTYYLRTLAMSQVEKSTVSTAEHGVTHKRSVAHESVASPSIVVRSEEKKQEVPAVPVAVAQETLATAVKPPKVRMSTEMAARIARGNLKLCAITDPACETCQ